MKQIAYIEWNKNLWEWRWDSDVYVLESPAKYKRCLKFYHISAEIIRRYNNIQNLHSWYEGSFLLNSPFFTSDKATWLNQNWNITYPVEQVSFRCLALTREILWACSIEHHTEVAVVDLPFQEGKTLRDLMFENNNPPANILAQELHANKVLDTINHFYEKKWLKLWSQTLSWRANKQIVGINIKITWYDREKNMLQLTITDLARDITEFVRNNMPY